MVAFCWDTDVCVHLRIVPIFNLLSDFYTEKKSPKSFVFMDLLLPLYLVLYKNGVIFISHYKDITWM